MGKVSPIKNSWSSGEFGPSLFGRTDVNQYQNASALVQNMICRPYGSLISTPGTKFVRETKDSSKISRLIQFIFSRTDAKIIEMGNEYMRFFSDASAEVGAPLTLDYMEYSTDALAQAAYVSSNSTFSDDFSGTLGSWTTLNGPWTITGGTTYPSSSTLTWGTISVTSATILNGSATMVLKSLANYSGIVFRGVDVNNFYYAILHSDANSVKIAKLVNGVLTILENGDVGYYPGDSERTLKTIWATEGAGTRIKVLLDGTEYINYLETTSTFALAGFVGMRFFYGGKDSYSVDGHYASSFSYEKQDLTAYSEATVKNQGVASLKGIAYKTDSLNKTLTRTIAIPVDLSTASQFSFDIRASRTGCNLSIGIHDSGGTTTTVTPTIATVNTWQTQEADLSAVTAANKDAIDSIIITITNADADNTFYIDNMYGLFSEIATPYTESQVFDIQYAQLNDVIYLAHPSHRVRKLTRLSTNEWELSDFDFLGGPFMPDNTTAITITPSGTAGSITLTLSATTSTIQFTPSGSTIGHIGSYWKIAGTRTDATTGLSTQGYVKIISVTSATVATATVMETLSSSAATASWAEGSWSAVRGYPARVAFHERRLFFARTTSEPQTIWGSKTFTYDDYALDAQADDDALNLPLASNEANDIKWIFGGDVLIAGTFGGDFVISSGGTGEALNPTNAVSKGYANWGSEAIQPRRIGNFLYYVQRFAKKLRELFYFYDQDTYKSVDKTIFSPHITDDGIVDIAYQQNPESILWGITSGGNIATLTREIDQEVQGWSRQTTDGLYESVACIPSQGGPYDEVWVIVNRTINGATKRYIEVFGDIEPNASVDLMFYVHSGLTYDAYDYTTGCTLSLSTGTGSTITGSSITLTLSATSSTCYFESNDIGQRVRAIDANRATLGEVTITSITSSTVAIGTVTTAFTTTSFTGMLWGKSVQTILGLEHLEQKTVSCLVDGSLDSSSHVVTGGTVTLDRDYFVAVIGLPYDQINQTLPIEAGSATGTAQGKIQRINSIGVKVNNSYTGFYIGGDSTHLERYVYRSPARALGTPETLYTGTLVNKTFKGNFTYGSQIYIKNSDPLPIELLSIFPSLTTQDN